MVIETTTETDEPAAAPRPRPSAPPPKPKPTKPAHFHGKFNLNKVQKVQVEIIDWKRCSVRAILLIAYVTLIHLFAYIVLLAYGFSLITRSSMLMCAFFGFFLDLGLYFFGSGAALRAITYVWKPCKFFGGILAVLIAMLLNVGLFFLGTFGAKKYRNTLLPVNLSHCETKNRANLRTKDDIEDDHCEVIEPVHYALLLMPFILPPIALVCIIIATAAAYKAVYLTPHKLAKWQVDAKWLEPYETYDFYVGKNIPKIPGYDDVYDEDFVEVGDVGKYFEEDDEDNLTETDVPVDDSMTQNTTTVTETDGTAAPHEKGHKKGHHPAHPHKKGHHPPPHPKQH